MRYTYAESPKCIGQFEHGDNVTIDIYRLSDNVKVVDGAECIEIDETGFFSYVPSSLEDTDFMMYFWIMTNGTEAENVYGELDLNGWAKSIEAISLGIGDTEITYTLTTTGGIPIADASIRVTSDASGLYTIASGRTNQSGQ